MELLLPMMIVLAIGIGLLGFFFVRSLLMPRQINAISELIKNGHTQAAAKAIRALIAKNPRHASAHYYLGLIYVAEGKGELALMEFKTVNQISQFGPELPEIEFRKRISGLYLRFNQVEEALKEYLVLIQLEPNVADNYYQAGKLFLERSRSDSAVGYFRKAIEIDPRHSNAHFELGKLLYREKKSLEAKSELNLAIKHNPDNCEAFYFMGKIQKESNEFTAALLSFEKAVRDPELKAKALVERGACYMSLNDSDRAIPELERAIKATKDESSNEALYGRYFLAMCFEKQREVDRAIEQWEKIYSRKTTFRDVAEKLSQYQEFRTDDKMKDYVTCGKEAFAQLCSSIVTSSMGLIIRETTDVPNGIDIIAVEADNQKWLGTKKLPVLYRFLRTADVLDESSVRTIIDKSKQKGTIRGVILTSSGFTRAATDFAENRPVELFTKENLQEFLDKADFFRRTRK
jgi:tetratricopeptide (TPR) repeat protein